MKRALTAELGFVKLISMHIQAEKKRMNELCTRWAPTSYKAICRGYKSIYN